DGTPRPRGLDEHCVEAVELVFKAIGYRGTEIPGVPYHPSWGIIPNDEGRVLTGPGGERVPGQYVVGWAKRGPSGLIGTNSPDSKATVGLMIEDLPVLKVKPLPADDAAAVPDLLRARGIAYVTYQDWQRLDELEQARGKEIGCVRCKFTDIPAM